ncbi:CheR family methyltransferase [Pseudomonas sp.]|uniref:CheR family methyltransferase n=1 Tax=Pseudomonas sp. TaxID=306 RepID=UPI00299DFF37|nr:CheR family methyltransferase [Pseudomonas sp.]MDX1368647.1 CheR family methyltransferase [Pseudomonas sp.]
MQRTEARCSPRLLAALNHKVHQHLGMDFSGARGADLLRRLQLLALELQVTDLEPWLQQLAFADWDAELVQTLIPAFSVGETYFRRDAEALDWLAVNHLGPLLARRRQAGQRSLRLWSAGCCTGEEAYSLLFLLDRLLGAERDSWTLELLASDINAAFLARAEQSLYGANAFRRNEATFRSQHFEAEGRLWRVRPAWRGRIRFIQYNLADDLHACPMQGADLILCRNVLMYFSPTRAASVLHRLLGCLDRDGLLLLSAVEAGIATQAGFNGFWAGCNYALSSSAGRAVPDAVPADFTACQDISPATSPSVAGGQASWPHRADSAVDVDRVWPPVKRADAGAPSEGLWQQAQRCLDAGDYATAREALLAYLACAGLSHAQQHQACLLLARIWADQQQIDEAQDWLQRALLLDPGSVMGYWLQALLAQQSGDIAAALLALQKTLYLDPGFILGYFLQARLLRVQGRGRASDKALQVCRQLLGEQDDEALVAQGDGMSCAQLLRVCEQLLEEQHVWPNR